MAPAGNGASWGRSLGRFARAVLLSYLVLVAFAALHVPVSRTSLERLVFAPVVALDIATAYGQFMRAGIFPFWASDAVELDDLIEAYGKEEWPGRPAVDFDTSPPGLEPGQEGRSSLELSAEHYVTSSAGAFLAVGSGYVFEIGDYTCLAEGSFGRPTNCFAIHSLGDGRFHFEGLAPSRSFDGRLDR